MVKYSCCNNYYLLFFNCSISLLRVLDLVVIVLTCLLSLSLSITIHSGLDTLCRSAFYSNSNCRRYKAHEGSDVHLLEYFDEINSAKVNINTHSRAIYMYFFFV